MKQLLYLILVIILISGCRNRYNPTPEEIIMLEETSRELHMDEAIEKAKRAEERKEYWEKQKKSSSAQTKKKGSQNHSNDEDDTDDYETKRKDNLRGYDPASEDDMEDNGMSRYMENYDEEGWY